MYLAAALAFGASLGLAEARQVFYSFNAPALAAAPAKSPAAAAAKGPLHVTEFRAFKLASREQLTPDTHLFKFALPKDESLGLPVASCLVTRAAIGPPKEGAPGPTPVFRPYTPTSLPEVKASGSAKAPPRERQHWGRISASLASLL